MFNNIKRVASAFKNALQLSYDAAEKAGRRRNRAVDRRGEDQVLRPRARDQVISDTRNLRRNFSIAAWGMRVHLDYVSTFTFKPRNASFHNEDPNKLAALKKLDNDVEAFMEKWSRPENCDVSQRYSLHELVRMAEACRLSDGDVFVHLISDGHVQIIEGDRVRNPISIGSDWQGYNIDDFSMTHGVKVTPSGKPVAYAVCDRDAGTNSFELRAIVPAQYILTHGFFERYDQIRGISPLVSAINSFSDVYEAAEFALAKAKVAQLFALKVTQGAPTELADGEIPDPYKFDFNGPQMLNMDPGDDAEFMESNTPSTEFQAFMVQMVQASLKSLDIPYSFYAENFTNYSGARQALLQYQISVGIKRQSVRKLLDDLTYWRLSLAVLDGELELPAGMTVDDLKWDWVGIGIPWIDPFKEAQANALMIATTMASRQQLAKERGTDWFKIVDEQAEEEAYAKSKNVRLADPTTVADKGVDPVEEDPAPIDIQRKANAKNAA